jgi:feruloyl esterase
LVVAGGAVAPAFAAGAPAPPAPPARATCAVASMQGVVSSYTTIVSTQSLTTPNTHTAYCRVDGYFTTSGPAGTNQVNFEVSLPSTFAGRYYFIGEGGAAGAVPDPVEQLLQQGWAQAGTDDRGPGALLDYSFAVDRTKALDYASRGVHLTTAETQTITRAYYGLGTKQGQLYRYVDGCSGGGRMGLVEASLYPSEYDGVLAGAPGSNSLNILKFGQIVDYLLRNPDSWVTPAQLQQLETAVIKKYDASDGAVDGFVRDPSKIDPSTFGSFGIFTPAQLSLVRLITSDLTVGNRVYKGYSASNPTGWAAFLTGTAPPSEWSTQPPPSFILFDTTTRGLFGLNYNFQTQFDFGNPADLQNWTTTFDQVFPSQNAGPASFDAFTRGGGKLLIWHGASDNGISVLDTVKLYQQIAAHSGGYATTQKSIRLFTVPGLFHCFSGPGPQDTPAQALAALTQWVEHGQAPQTIVVNSAPDQPKASFRLCPYPSAATFLGGVNNPTHLDPLNAANWVCR